jgi:preprotein translocase subunit SecA
MEDTLMRLFGGQNIMSLMNTLGWERGEPLEHGMLSRAIAKAQKRVETHHYEMRKQVLKYDDVMNEQRTIIYEQRHNALKQDSLREEILQMFDDIIENYVNMFVNPNMGASTWDFEALASVMKEICALNVHHQNLEQMKPEDVMKWLQKEAKDQYLGKAKEVDPKELEKFEKYLLLQIVDEYWKEHLYVMDHLQDGIGLRGYAGKNPLVEYKIEALDLFNIMIVNIKEAVVRHLSNIHIEAARDEPLVVEDKRRDDENLNYGAPDAGSRPEPKKNADKTGRNSPCPCGSGQKFKKCCGRK